MTGPIVELRHERNHVAEDFDSYVEAHARELLRLAFVLTGNDADAQDVVQEALARAFPRWDRISGADDVHAYVRRMVVNARTSWWRRTRKRELPREEVIPTGASAPVDTETRDEQEAMWQACLALPRDQRVAVVLRYYEGLSYAEIGAVTECAEGTARARVFRGLKNLREQLGEQLGEEER